MIGLQDILFEEYELLLDIEQHEQDIHYLIMNALHLNLLLTVKDHHYLFQRVQAKVIVVVVVNK